MERLAGRYDLLTPVAVGQGRVLWQAHDDVLDRGVGVMLLERDDPRARKVRTAAQKAAAVEHPHLQQVVDVDVDDGRVFVVTRWSAAHTLADIITARNMRSADAADLVRQIADALAAADGAGLHHLVLDPRDVLVGESGALVTGLGVRAAIAEEEDDDSGALRDVRRLGALLYATLTGCWPDGPCAGLPAAPRVDDAPARPRQVRAGVPTTLDEIAWRAMGFPGDGPPLDTAAAVSVALAATVDADGSARDRHSPDTSGRPSWPAIAGLLAVVAILAAGVVLLGWQVWQDRSTAAPVTSAEPSPSRTSVSPTPGTPVSVPIASVTVLDPQGDQTENDDQAAAAIDGDLTSAWTTVTYTTRDLGGLKQGVGLVLGLKHRTPVSGVDIELVGRGTDLQVLTTRADPTKLSDYRLAAEVVGAGDRLTLRFAPAVPSDAVLIWLTGLPGGENGYQGGVADVVVRAS
ncbi:MAG: hypothetical protein WAN48_01285 [Actinomycetes bacterium]